MAAINETEMPVEDNSGYQPSVFPGSTELVRTQEDLGEARGLQTETLIPKLGGLIEVAGTDAIAREEAALAAAEELRRKPIIQGVASYIRERWEEAKSAKEQTVEQRMLSNLRQRRGEYDPDVEARLKEQRSAMVFMQITSNKCRAGAAWLRDALGEMPWSCEPTPVSDIEPELEARITQDKGPEAIMMMLQAGYQPSPSELVQLMTALKDGAKADVQESARRAAERMTRKMQDQLLEGGFEDALDQFIDDLATFPAAIMKGPVVRRRPTLAWTDVGNGSYVPNVKDTYRLEWERVSPFDIYPAPDASDIDDGYLIERHRLSRSDLQALRDVEGYSPTAVDGALAEYKSGYIDEISIDASREAAEGKSSNGLENPSKLIEALQFWGPIPGYMLLEWGMTPEEIGVGFDPLNDYNIEAWLVGSHVIKLQLNPDPLNRKPYYKTSWENVPGSFWGNSIPDLCRDVQRICNSAARALVNNMGIASGPQVVVDVGRLPKGASITEMYPWKIWMTSDARIGGSTQPPVNFFQPGSNAQELMQIYNQFAALADEHTGIPRYMTGNSPAGGAGRTASGMSMLMSNAGKSIKAVVASVDRIMKPMIERLYFYNMLYADDPELKGDVNIVPRGALNLLQKETQQQRINEFLSIALSNPMVGGLVGEEGLSYLLRQIVDKLGLNSDKIIPLPEVLRVKNYIASMQMQAQMLQQQNAAAQLPDGGSNQGTPPNPQNQMDQRQLMDGSPQSNTKAAK